MADRQTSPGNALSPSRLCLPHLRPRFPCRYWALSLIALSPSMAASYAISVRQASALPAASFRSHLAVNTLAVRLTVPPAGSVGDLHPQVSAPCRAHNNKGWPIKAIPSTLEAVHPPLTCSSRRYRRSRLRPGNPAAHKVVCLPLLPSGPDGVHKASLRRTQPSTLLAPGRPQRRQAWGGSSIPL